MAESSSHIHDILIIGAGPCGLSLAARLHEQTPSALFTDSEHQRYHWMRSSSSSRKNSKFRKTSRRANTAQDRLLAGPSLGSASSSSSSSSSSGNDEGLSREENDLDRNGIGLDIAVLDANGDQWMGAWDKKFKDLKITHLRSPMFFHPDPRDRDGLLGFAYRDGVPREGELKEIKGVVGKGLSKYQRKQKNKSKKSQQQETSYLDERSRHDYFRPSQSLFSAYCTDIITRYKLSSLVQKSEVLNITFDSVSEIFTLETSTGVKYARIVVLATGASVKPGLPVVNPFTPAGKGSVSHAFAPNGILPVHLKQKIAAGKQTNVAVIGAGLTSAQVTSFLSSSSPHTKIHHFTRRPLQTKHFDVSLPWIGKYKNFHLAAFWSADSDAERAEMIKQARDGGSVNPEYKSLLLDLVKKGRVVLHEERDITSAKWHEDEDGDGERGFWTVMTNLKVEGIEDVRFDHVVYATGVEADIVKVPFMKTILEGRNIDVVGGMPCLTDDLMWDESMPLFVTGRLAGLRLGPGAGNLEGARMGAERVAWKVGEILGRVEDGAVKGIGKGVGRRDSGYSSGELEVDMGRLGLGSGNQFQVFEEGGEEDGEDGV